MKREIIKIDTSKCNGCGQCIPGCPEGALQVIDGKARLISDLFCDGLGACIGTCPQEAITVEEREAEPYNERRVMENIIEQGPNVIKAHLVHLKEHNEKALLEVAVQVLKEKGIEVPEFEPKAAGHCGHGNSTDGHHHENGCPGAAMRDLRGKKAAGAPGNSMVVNVESQLRQWPIQLQLVNPHAPYFQDAHLLVAADCVPFAFANFHERFLKDKIMVTFCPKLDKTIDQYIEKLTAMFVHNTIRSISVVHMEVPCCSGTVAIVQRALEQAQKMIPIREYTISLDGQII